MVPFSQPHGRKEPQAKPIANNTLPGRRQQFLREPNVFVSGADGQNSFCNLPRSIVGEPGGPRRCWAHGSPRPLEPLRLLHTCGL